MHAAYDGALDVGEQRVVLAVVGLDDERAEARHAARVARVHPDARRHRDAVVRKVDEDVDLIMATEEEDVMDDAEAGGGRQPGAPWALGGVSQLIHRGRGRWGGEQEMPTSSQPEKAARYAPSALAL